MYLLDTNILSEFVKKRPNEQLLAKVRAQNQEELFTATICLMELRYGSKLRDDFDSFWSRLEREVISKVSVVSIDEETALVAGDILSDLKKTGATIGIEDVLIAASAKANKFTVVTANTRHFSRINGLDVENWLEAV
jgi:tRNA(fMet)-specific endonuclease VapC